MKPGVISDLTVSVTAESLTRRYDSEKVIARAIRAGAGAWITKHLRPPQAAEEPNRSIAESGAA